MAGANIYGELYNAQLENSAADPSFSAAQVGRVVWQTTQGRVRFNNGAAYRSLLANDDKLVIGTNGTANTNVRLNRSGAGQLSVMLGGDATAEGSDTAANWGKLNAKLGGSLVDTYADFTEVAAPTAPAASTRRLYFKTDGKLYAQDSAGVETQVGGSAAGGINYDSNSDAETNTTGYAVYADAAGTTPVDGTGGAANVTITRQTSNILRGAASFRLTKDAANRQGQGVSYDFTIAAADKAKPLTVSFEYHGSTNFVAGSDSTLGDVVVWVYDVTNAVLIPVTPYKLVGGPGAPWKFSGVFQTASNSTSYRLIWHIAATHTNAWTLDLDTIVVGPQVQLYGAPVTDWTSFTSTTGLTGGTTTHTGYWRRVGDTMEVTIDAIFTSVFTAGTATFTLPSGYTIDTAKLTSSAVANTTPVLGSAILNDIGTDAFPGLVYYASASTVLVRGYTDDSGAGSLYINSTATVSTTVPFTWANNDRLSLSFKVPIVGWGSNCLMSNDADTRVVAARYTGTPVTGTLGAAFNTVTFGTKTLDTHNAMSGSTYTVQVAGKYRVTAQLGMLATYAAGNTTAVQISKNGTGVAIGDCRAGSASEAFMTPHVSDILDCVAGDTITIQSYNGGTGPTFSSGVGYSFVAIERLSGPSAIAASETIAARYTTAAGQSMTDATHVIVDYGTRDYDTHGAVTTGASWAFVAPAAGKYRITAFNQLNTGGGWAAGEEMRLTLYKNGSAFTVIESNIQQVAHTTNVTGRGSVEVNLLAGDSINIRCRQSSGAAITLTADALYNHIEISRIGL